MEGYKLSQQAARDYREILAFTLNEWGVNQFEKYASLLDEAFNRLVEMPTSVYGAMIFALGFIIIELVSTTFLSNWCAKYRNRSDYSC